MAKRKLKLRVLGEKSAVLKLPPTEPVPVWIWEGDFCSISRTGEELSIVCPQGNIPEGFGYACSGGWRALKVEGTLDFSLTGILAGISAPLAEAGISIFAVSTFNTDYILVRENQLDNAIRVLEGEGYQIAR